MRKNKTRRMTLTAILAAIIVVLQLLTSVIKFGAINPSLVLVPVTVGAVLLGPGTASFLGGVVGLVVYLMCAFGADPGGYILFCADPVVTFLLCMGKGILSGLASGLIFKYVKVSKNSLAANTLLPAIAAPVVNTGIFCTVMLLVFRGILAEWAAGAGATDIMVYIITGLVGVNFVVELLLNIILCPVIAERTKKYRNNYI